MPNRLAQETSPYLLQHQDNPVDWYPWGPEALDRARRENKPMLVSIGYSACHWCHVMAHESFENASIANLMNESFVNIKVDREERPDIDSIYMSAVQAMTGQGGWPLNVFVTPDGVPFFGGTYWPPSDRMGMPGFPRVLSTLATAWRDNRDAIEANATKLREYLRASTEASPAASAIAPSISDSAAVRMTEQFDREHGGFGGAPKFPQPSALDALLRRYRRTGDENALAMVTHTLDTMGDGGIYDHLGGGFARYAVDAIWLVPHFEKMLYDNAQLMSIYLDAWRITGIERYREIVEQTAAWTLREMTSPEGGFYAALDADSEGEEGKFYVWTSEEIDAALDADAADLVKLHFGVTPEGNFEGKSILFVHRDADELAGATGQPVDKITVALEAAKQTLLDLRERRVRPGRDDKIITAWNGLTLKAFAGAGSALDRSDLLDAARRNAAFLLANALDADGKLCRSWKDGQRRGNGVLEDYVFLAEGLFALYQATGESRWLVAADELVEQVRQRFGHESGAGFYDTASDHEVLVSRPRDLQDGATPAGNSVAADVLVTLGTYRGEIALIDAADQILASMAHAVEEHPVALGRFLAVIERRLAERRELVFAGDPASAEVRALTYAAARRYEPFVVTGFANPANPELAERFSMLADRPLPQGMRAAAYLCENFTCKPPVSTAQELVTILDDATVNGTAS